MAPSSVHSKVMKVASDLFYRQGYHATGINQIIAESGVAKASFYDHFPSKEELLVEYIRQTARQEIEELRAIIATLGSPRDRFLGLMRMVTPWLEKTCYRGCPFQNISAEAPTDNPRIREVLRQHRENLRALLTEQAWDLVREEPKLSQINIPSIVTTYLLLLEGAIAMAVAYRDPWPIESATTAIQEMLQPG